MPKILIADDDIEMRQFLRDELEEAGYSVTTVANGAEAVIEAAEHEYDLVLMDMLMPGLDGAQAMRVLRAVRPSLRLLGLTGYVGRGYMSIASGLNVTCLSKPIEVNALLREIREALSAPRTPGFRS